MFRQASQSRDKGHCHSEEYYKWLEFSTFYIIHFSFPYSQFILENQMCYCVDYSLSIFYFLLNENLQDKNTSETSKKN